MSFIAASAAVLGTTGAVGIGTTMLAGAMMGGAVTIGTNLIRGNDPFDNIGQGILVGGIGGAFNPAAGAAGAGEGAALTTTAEGTALAGAQDWAALDTMAGVPAGGTYGLEAAAPGAIPDPYNLQPAYTPSESYWSQSASGPTVPSDAPPVQAGQIAGNGTDPYGLTGGDGSRSLKGGFRLGEGGIENQFRLSPNPVKLDYLTGSFKEVSPAVAGKPPVPKAEFFDNPLTWMDQNKFQTAVGGLGVAGAMGAFSPKTGLNLPPRTFEVANTTYSPGTRNPNFGRPGEPYFLGQGYGPMTRETRTVAAGGGIRSLSGGGETAPYVPMPSRGFMTNKESIPDSAEDSAAFKRYLKSDINKDEETGQAAIDKTVMAWLERHAKSDIAGTKNMFVGGETSPVAPAPSGARSSNSLFGGMSNLPAAYQQPQYQMSDFANSPLFQPTGGNAPMQPGISEYIANMNQYTPPAPAAAPAPVVTDTTSPILYNQNTQRYSDNPNYAAPVAPVAPVDNDGGDEGSGDKAGGPIKSRRYAMGGLAALPEYAAGGQLLSGDGDGMSDSIPAVIKGARPQRAALADGEFVIPADVVSHLGNGSTKAGGKRLYEMMATIRKARTGNSKQGKQINPMKFMPA